MANLYLLCGPAGSGKSTWAKAHFKPEQIVSRDVIRFGFLKDGDDYFSKEKEVYAKFIATIQEKLNNGEDAVADATHLTPRNRDKLLKQLNLKNVSLHAINFIVNKSICIENNKKRTGRALVPESVISNMCSSFTAANFKERNYATITNIYISIDDNGKYKYDMEAYGGRR